MTTDPAAPSNEDRENTLVSLRIAATAIAGPGGVRIEDGVLVYAGSAQWAEWENHLPMIVRQVWPNLSEESRLALFIMAKSFSMYGAD